MPTTARLAVAIVCRVAVALLCLLGRSGIAAGPTWRANDAAAGTWGLGHK